MTLGDFDHKARLLRHFWLTYNKKSQTDLKPMMVAQGRRVFKEMKDAVNSGKVKKADALKKIKEYKLESFLEILKYEQ